MRRSLLLLLLEVACGPRSDVDRQADAMTADVVGAWHIRMVADAARSETSLAATPSTTGDMILMPNREVARAYPVLGRPIAYGTYSIDLAPLGLDVVRDGVPSAVAGRLLGDSVAVALQPAGDVAPILLRGSVSRDSIVGRWTIELTRAVGAGGGFIMERAGRSRLPDSTEAPADRRRLRVVRERR